MILPVHCTRLEMVWMSYINSLFLVQFERNQLHELLNKIKKLLALFFKNFKISIFCYCPLSINFLHNYIKSLQQHSECFESHILSSFYWSYLNRNELQELQILDKLKNSQFKIDSISSVSNFYYCPLCINFSNQIFRKAKNIYSNFLE